jgi:hypothetical protein
MGEHVELPRTSSLRCKVGMHNWLKKTNDEGDRYLECSRCGKEDAIRNSAAQALPIRAWPE